jgi:dual specificity protein kinase YAK1
MEEGGGRQEDAAPPWAPSEATAFRRFAAATASGRSQEATPSASGNGAASRVSSLHGVRRKSVCLGLLHHPCSVASAIEFMGIAK